MNGDFDNLEELLEESKGRPGMTDSESESVKKQEDYNTYQFLIKSWKSTLEDRNEFLKARVAEASDAVFSKALSRYGDSVRAVSREDYKTILRKVSAVVIKEYKAFLDFVEGLYDQLGLLLNGESYKSPLEYEAQIPETAEKARRATESVVDKAVNDLATVVEKHKAQATTPSTPSAPKPSPAPSAPSAPKPSPAPSAPSALDQFWEKNKSFLLATAEQDVAGGRNAKQSLEDSLQYLKVEVSGKDFDELFKRIANELGLAIEKEEKETEEAVEKSGSEAKEEVKARSKRKRELVKNFFEQFRKLGTGLNPYTEARASHYINKNVDGRALEAVSTYNSIIQEFPNISLATVAKVARERRMFFHPAYIQALYETNPSLALQKKRSGQEYIDFHSLSADLAGDGTLGLKVASENAKAQAKKTSSKGRKTTPLDILKSFGRGGFFGAFESLGRYLFSNTEEERFQPVSSEEVTNIIESARQDIERATLEDGSIDLKKLADPNVFLLVSSSDYINTAYKIALERRRQQGARAESTPGKTAKKHRKGGKYNPGFDVRSLTDEEFKQFVSNEFDRFQPIRDEADKLNKETEEYRQFSAALEEYERLNRRYINTDDPTEDQAHELRKASKKRDRAYKKYEKVEDKVHPEGWDVYEDFLRFKNKEYTRRNLKKLPTDVFEGFKSFAGRFKGLQEPFKNAWQAVKDDFNGVWGIDDEEFQRILEEKKQKFPFFSPEPNDNELLALIEEKAKLEVKRGDTVFENGAPAFTDKDEERLKELERLIEKKKREQRQRDRKRERADRKARRWQKRTEKWENKYKEKKSREAGSAPQAPEPSPATSPEKPFGSNTSSAPNVETGGSGDSSGDYELDPDGFTIHYKTKSGPAPGSPAPGSAPSGSPGSPAPGGSGGWARVFGLISAFISLIVVVNKVKQKLDQMSAATHSFNDKFSQYNATISGYKLQQDAAAFKRDVKTAAEAASPYADGTTPQSLMTKASIEWEDSKAGLASAWNRKTAPLKSWAMEGFANLNEDLTTVLNPKGIGDFFSGLIAPVLSNNSHDSTKERIAFALDKVIEKLTGIEGFAKESAEERKKEENAQSGGIKASALLRAIETMGDLKATSGFMQANNPSNNWTAGFKTEGQYGRDASSPSKKYGSGLTYQTRKE